MVKVAVRRFKAVERTLKSASEDALKIAIPIKKSHHEASWNISEGGGQHSTEQRWLGRMVTNTLGEVRARAELDDSAPDFLEQNNLLRKEDAKMAETKKRKRDEIVQLEKRLESTRRRVLAKVETQCSKGLTSLRPLTKSDDAAPSMAAEGDDASEILENIAPLHDRAERLTGQLDDKSKALSGRISGLRNSTEAVASFLHEKPTRVEESIMRGAKMTSSSSAVSAGESESEEEATPTEGTSQTKKGGSRNGISSLSQHLAPR